MHSRRVLVTGGTGYIGSHTVVQLLGENNEVVIFDNLSNSQPAVLSRIHSITGKKPVFVNGDIRDRDGLRALFEGHRIDAVIHFGGLKAVGESVAKPMLYYENNVVGSLNLFNEMTRAGIKRLVFSSSATVYGDPINVPIRENSQLQPTNPYGRSKLIVEDILRDIGISDSEWKFAILRYFNPVGAHISGLIGEDPLGTPNNLMPLIAQVATGNREKLSILGNDYPTSDGTGVRDYIHVEDLARAHLLALKKLQNATDSLTVNLGTGQGYSVLDIVTAFEKASGKSIPFEMIARRPGDVAISFADPSLANKLLGWTPSFGVDRMCEDVWRWQSMNPKGYQTEASNLDGLNYSDIEKTCPTIVMT